MCIWATGGSQWGLVINELKVRKPDLVYFDENYTGEYPTEPPFTIAELEEIYPFASKRSKEDEAYKADAMACTFKLQSGVRGYRALLEAYCGCFCNGFKENISDIGSRV